MIKETFDTEFQQNQRTLQILNIMVCCKLIQFCLHKLFLNIKKKPIGELEEISLFLVFFLL